MTYWDWQGGESGLYRRFAIWSPTLAHHITFGGVYVMVRRDGDGNRTALYIGEAEHLGAKLAHHDKWMRCKDLGMNEIHILATFETARATILHDLRRGHPSVLNEPLQGLRRFGVVTGGLTDQADNATPPNSGRRAPGTQPQLHAVRP
jgi:hypothetical protein